MIICVSPKSSIIIIIIIIGGGAGQILSSNLTLHVYIIHEYEKLVRVRHTCEELVQIFLRCEN